MGIETPPPPLGGGAGLGWERSWSSVHGECTSLATSQCLLWGSSAGLCIVFCSTRNCSMPAPVNNFSGLASKQTTERSPPEPRQQQPRSPARSAAAMEPKSRSSGVCVHMWTGCKSTALWKLEVSVQGKRVSMCLTTLPPLKG